MPEQNKLTTRQKKATAPPNQSWILAVIVAIVLVIGIIVAVVVTRQQSRGEGVEQTKETVESVLKELHETSNLRTPRNFTVAFIGDQGAGDDARNVLELIKSEGAEMVVHAGDFDYQDDPDAWDNLITSVLGEAFPYFAVVGNHDVAQWPAYQEKLRQRLERIDGEECTGVLGEAGSCTYKGIFVVMSGVGTIESSSAALFAPELASSDATWKICTWHKNQRLMQVGGKENEVGWQPYDDCRDGGAMIVTGHEHSYARTHLLSNIEQQDIASTSNVLTLEQGKTFVAVTGLGGQSVRDQNATLAEQPWWASVYTNQQNAAPGALFCTFNKDGIENEAECFFKDINGNIPDTFSVRSAIKR